MSNEQLWCVMNLFVLIDRDEARAKYQDSQAVAETLRTRMTMLQAKIQKLQLENERLRKNGSTGGDGVRTPATTDNESTNGDAAPADPPGKLLAMDVPPGPIGVKLSKVKPVTVLEVLTLPDGSPSPLAGRVKAGDILEVFDGANLAEMTVQVRSHYFILKWSLRECVLAGISKQDDGEY